MEQTVYVDLYFLINFSMDFLCLFLTARLLSYPISTLRTVLASALGGIYACTALFIGASGVFGVLTDLFAGILISAICVFRRGRVKQCASFALVFAAVSIVVGGFMTALFSLFNKIGLDSLLGSEEDADGVSIWLFTLLAVIGGGISAIGGRFFRRKSARRDGEVRITYRTKSIVLKAICDSGNLLREPISNKPCIVADREAVAKILPRGLLVKNIGELSACGEEMGRIRIIPASTVNKESVIYAVRMDKISINMGKGWKETDAFIALGEIKNGADGARALIPSELAFGAP